MKKIMTTSVAINPDRVIEVNGRDFVNIQIAPAQFAILAIFYQYGSDGIIDAELLTITKELYQQCPIRGLIFDEEDVLPICSQLTIKDLLTRGKNGFIITNKGKDYFNSFLDIGDIIPGIVPRQEIINIQSKHNLPKKI